MVLFVVVVGVVVSGVVVSVERAFTLLLPLLGHSLDMCPWTRHLKHRPSFLYRARSSSESFLKGRVVVVASTSMGTCCWLFWEVR